MVSGLRDRFFGLLFVCLLAGTAFFLLNREGISVLRVLKNDGVERVFSRVSLEREARRAVQQGELDRAIDLYREAIEPDKINLDHEKSTAVGALTAIYKWRCEYEQAQKTQSWFLRHDSPAASAIEQKKEIEALLNYRDSGDPYLVYRHITELMTLYGKSLPPVGHNALTNIIISDLIRLYNTIGDHDAGIKMIDEILIWMHSKNDAVQRVNSAAEAQRLRSKMQAAGKEWYPYKILWEYHTIREAFEQDKKDGFKGCAGSPPGQVCIGKATQALIKSDYFPW